MPVPFRLIHTCGLTVSLSLQCFYCVIVGRFVKYTGYGNAAGLLAQRGLMCGGHGAIYSSESEDSETEEYSQLKDKYVIHVFYYILMSISSRLCMHYDHQQIVLSTADGIKSIACQNC